MHIYSRAKYLGARAAVDPPFLIIRRLLPQQRCLGEQRQQVLVAERNVAELSRRAAIRIRWRQHGVAAVATHAQHNQRRTHEGLEAEIAMNVLDQFPIARYVPRIAVGSQRRARLLAALASKPGVKRSQETLPPGRHDEALPYGLQSVRNVAPKKLADEGPTRSPKVSPRNRVSGPDCAKPTTVRSETAACGIGWVAKSRNATSRINACQ